MQRDSFILYGLSKSESTISELIEDLQLRCNGYHFDLKLLLTEALTNAFMHGNEMNEEKPIYLRYEYVKETNYIKFEIKDSGNDLKDIEILDEITDDMLENTSGRGLYLIKCVSDNIYFKENAMVIEKCLN